MAGSRSDPVLRQVHRLFNIGSVGTMSDAELLDRFVSHRDESAEAAFEELVSRHGPMVLRVCRSVLRDAHDAEDAFQAVFLVLANRARSIRRRGSVASWLFGVAQRVAICGNGRFRLTDDARRVTTIGESGRVAIDQSGQTVTRPEAARVEPIITGGKLVSERVLEDNWNVAAGASAIVTVAW